MATTELKLIEEIKIMVDHLQPQISPYESDVYWFMFRHSHLEGRNNLTVSSTRLAAGIGMKFKSVEKLVKKAADKTISNNLRGLAKIGAIVKVGEPSRSGTPYEVILPSQIPPVMKRMAGLTTQEKAAEADSLSHIDHYNVRHLRLEIFKRDNYLCYKCGKLLTQKTATLDHINPLSGGGDHSADNLITCCLLCNSSRRNTALGDFLSAD